MIRGLLFMLFLYIAFVWLIATSLYKGNPERLLDKGLLWTSFGVGGLLVGLILERIIGWVRLRRIQKPRPPGTPGTPIAPSKPPQDDRTALSNLLSEASERWARSPGASSTGRPQILDLPLYLVVGAEGSGK